MSKRLWNYFDGEPFLDNPHLAVLTPNPRKRTKGKIRMARTKARRRNAPRRRTRVVSRSRRRARRNPWPVGGLVINPRRRRRHAARRNPVAHRRHRRIGRRNPALLGLQLPAVQSIIFAGVGFAGIPALQSLVNPMLPTSMVPTTPAGRYVSYAAYGLGLTYAVKAFVGHESARMTAIGAGTFIMLQAIKDFMPNMIPGLSGYVAPNMGAYVQGNQPNFRQLSGLGMPQASFPGNGSVMPANRIPNRFSRY